MAADSIHTLVLHPNNDSEEAALLKKKEANKQPRVLWELRFLLSI